ncbi:hypothetical protein [Accumulibacter sp.]|uniref:hypothetical protein n=1 Tax=Accumulibacter sp. TaxID=2053492 RepID=UPI002585A0E3|nr:hypothetical protein [Accumulibacter sp.]
MAKAMTLTPDALKAPQITPKAATPARSLAAQPKADIKADQVPLQVRIPREEARAIKIAAAERDQTISEFMLACFHAYMKGGRTS